MHREEGTFLKDSRRTPKAHREGGRKTNSMKQKTEVEKRSSTSINFGSWNMVIKMILEKWPLLPPKGGKWYKQVILGVNNRCSKN